MAVREPPSVLFVPETPAGRSLATTRGRRPLRKRIGPGQQQGRAAIRLLQTALACFGKPRRRAEGRARRVRDLLSEASELSADIEHQSSRQSTLHRLVVVFSTPWWLVVLISALFACLSRDSAADGLSSASIHLDSLSLFSC